MAAFIVAFIAVTVPLIVSVKVPFLAVFIVALIVIGRKTLLTFLAAVVADFLAVPRLQGVEKVLGMMGRNWAAST